jgi:hypothetical protein
MLDDNHMTEAANISFFTVFYKLFSVNIKSGTRTVAPEWTAQIVSTVVGKSEEYSTFWGKVNGVLKTYITYYKYRYWKIVDKFTLVLNLDGL